MQNISIRLILVAGLIAFFPAWGGEFSSLTEQRIVDGFSRGTGWYLNGGNFRGEHFSPLDQVNTKNVNSLGLDWSLDLPSPDGIAATPLVADGIIYLSGPFSIVYAVDADSGKLLWTYNPKVEIRDANDWTARVNRGVALWGDHVLLTVSDCRLIALKRHNGKPVWSRKTCDPEQGYSITDAPHVGGGRVYVGNAGSESHFKNRGHVSAWDAKTGEFLWRFYTVPADSAEENTTPAMQAAWKSWHPETLKKYGGGGSAWNGMTYDKETGLLYFGTAGSLPYLYSKRSPNGGDNLYTSSIVALNAATGEYAWHYQTVPEDNWDYNANMNIVLADLEIGGRARKVLMVAPKNGFFYVIDRHSGALLSAEPYVKVNWASHIDLETGRPVLSPEAMFWKTPPGTATLVWPNLWGAHSTQPMAFHPGTGLVYIPAANVPSEAIYYGDGEYDEELRVFDQVDGKPHVPGMLVAWDPVRRNTRWSVDHQLAFNGGVLATAGKLVFQGDAKGAFSAYDALNGEQLWRAETGSAISAAPVSYRAGERQRVLVPVGAGGAMQFSYPTHHHGKKTRGPTRLMSFSLAGKASIPGYQAVEPVLPELPKLTATTDNIEQGRKLYVQQWCGGCHGAGAVARPGGSVPDLRYASKQTHAQWAGIVVGGAREARGMPAHEITVNEAEAIRAWVLSRAYELRDQQ